MSTFEDPSSSDSSSIANDLARLIDSGAVREDPDLLPAEKETHANFSQRDDEAHVKSEIGCHMRRLLQHPHFTLIDYRTTEIDSEPQIVRVEGFLPIGCISIGYSPRKDSSLANVVSNNVLKTDEQCSVELDRQCVIEVETYTENETTIQMTKHLDTVTVWSSENGLSNRLDAHPEYDGGVPVGCLTITSEPRKSDRHADLVTSNVL